MNKSAEAGFELILMAFAIVLSGVTIVLCQNETIATIIEYAMWVYVGVMVVMGSVIEYREWIERKQKKEMTLDEAIEHCDERANKDCSACAKDHAQLASWLRELKELRKETNND